jgi:hypothetical protein
VRQTIPELWLANRQSNPTSLPESCQWRKTLDAALPNYIPRQSGRWHLHEKLRLCIIPENFLHNFSPHES